MLNSGLSEATGRLCQKWDDDDWYSPEFLETLVSAYFHSTRDSGRRGVVYLVETLWLDLSQWRVLGPSTELLTGSTLLFDREAWSERPFRENRISEDWWFAVDQLKTGALAVPVFAPGLYVCVRHDGAGGERSHSWTRFYEDLDTEKLRRDRRFRDVDPTAVLPDWIVSTYRELRAETRPSDSSRR